MMNEQEYRYRIQWLVLIGGVILLVILFGAWISDGVKVEWKERQKEYHKLLTNMPDSPGTAGDAKAERGIFQVEIPALRRIDRCITCHQGLEDPRLVNVSQPHTLHPGSYLDDHPLYRFGCTICHGGQGRALTSMDAHGKQQEAHWPYPVMEQPYLQAACGKCHLSIFNHRDPDQAAEMEGMEIFLRGKSIFSAEGCLGCHKARGVGGIIGPDLTEQGEKTKHEYSFRNVRGEQTISNWLNEHFRDPEMVSPGSRMLRINLEEGELEALATFVMGLAKPEMSFDYFSLATLNEFKGIREPLDGVAGFDYICSACHGKNGEGKDYTAYETGIPAIGNTDFQRVASEDYIRFTLEKGRSLRQMGSWAPSVSGLLPEELDRITRILKTKNERSVDELLSGEKGNPESGREMFDRFCTACHGPGGAGGVAVALNQEGFLSRADNRFILQTMLRGRRNTAMPAWFQLEDQQLLDLVACIRSWSDSQPARGTMLLPVTDLEDGALKYHYLCSRCHGEFGEGETGPAVINRDFLVAAGDWFLYETISKGREHTAMFGWSADVYNQEKLDIRAIGNIVGFMRSSAQEPPGYIYAGSNPGNHQSGAILFKENCTACHGSSGEGIKAPALNNQEFLSAASNGYLMATITSGRNRTAMPSWGYGEGEYPALTGAERQNLVAFIRSWQRIRIKY